MVKPNPDRENNIHASSLVLEDSDKQAIRDALSDAPVEVNEMRISNPMNDLEGLYIQIKSSDRDDLYDEETTLGLMNAARAVGYNQDKMQKGNFPSSRDGYYTLAIWFKHRR